MKRRAFRVAEAIRSAVAQYLLQRMDERFSLVTITGVVVSSDLKVAKIYWVVSGDDERRHSVEEAFSESRGALRRAVAQGVQLRGVPELRFYYDDTLDTMEAVERLLQDSHDNNQEPVVENVGELHDE